MKSQLSVVTLFSQIQRHKEYLKVTTKGGTSHFQVIVEVKSQIMENCIFLNKIINFKKRTNFCSTYENKNVHTCICCYPF